MIWLWKMSRRFGVEWKLNYDSFWWSKNNILYGTLVGMGILNVYNNKIPTYICSKFQYALNKVT